MPETQTQVPQTQHNEYQTMPVTEDIVGREPSWIVKSGIGLIAAVMALLFFLAWFIRYPDALYARVSILSTSPPAELKARQSARIETVDVISGQKVQKGQTLMQLESGADSAQVLTLLNYLASPGSAKNSISDIPHLDQLGDIQSFYKDWYNAQSALDLNSDSTEHESKIASLLDRETQREQILQTLSIKRSRFANKLQLHKKELDDNKSLLARGLISESNILPLDRRYLDAQIELDELELEIRQSQLQLSELNYQQDLLKAQKKDQSRRLTYQANITKSAMISALANWQTQYQVIAPIAGTISMVKPWKSNQSIVSDELAFHIVNPANTIEAYLTVNHLGAGKIKPKQQVEIELDSYPSKEFGKIVGEVDSVALVPTEAGYLVRISLPEKLVTTYNIAIKVTPNLVGNARILTEEMSFAARLLNTITSLNS